MIWGMAAGASVLLAANFAVRKKCTADWGQGLRAALLFNLVLGLLGFLVFFGHEVFDWCRDTLTGYKRRHDWQNRNR